MRHAPYTTEYLEVTVMSEGELMEYFLTRSYETEEVWTLQNDMDWLLLQHGDMQYLPVWPYQRFAEEAMPAGGGYNVIAYALEDFVFETLPELIERDIGVEIMPRATGAGCFITPHRLLDIIGGMMESGEYRLDG